MARLPVQGSDDGVWGSILNDFLTVAHNADGTLQSSALSNAGGLLSGGAAGGDLSGTWPNPTIAKIRGTAIATPPGTTTQFLRGDGSWAAPSGGGQPISNVRAISGTGSVTANAWDTLEVDATSQAVTVTLPTNTNGTVVTIKKVDSTTNTVTVSGTIDGTVNPALKYQWGTLYIIGDGTNWRRIDRHTLVSLVDVSVASAAQGDILSWNGTSWVNTQLMLNVKLFGAKGDNATDDTTAIQNAINAANTAGLAVYFPAAKYRVSQLTLLSGTILQGVSAGTYPGDDNISGVSVLVRIASTNLDVLVAPDGTNYCRIYDIAIDGNKNNNTAGYGLNIQDGAAGQESQIIVERCFFQSNPNSNLYLGNNRRANKVLNSVFNYSGSGDGITVAGSDNTIQGNICGTNARAGINLGTTVTQNWASFGSNLNSTTTHVYNNDIYGNLVGIAIPQNATRSIIVGNGIDRNQNQGISVYNGDCNTIIGNAFHSNGQAATNTYGHIDLASGVTNVDISNNTFGPLDGGMTNVCSYCVTLQTGIGSGTITGNIGVFDATDTVNGLISAAGGNTSPSVMLSKGGGIVQAGQSGQQAFMVKSATGSTLFEVSNGGSMNLLAGAAVFANPQNLWGGNNSNLSVANTTATFLSPNSTTQNIAVVEAASQSANLATFYASNGTTVLAQVDKSGGISVLGNTGATAASRYAGATTSGAPTSGTFNKGDFIIDQTATIWICTTAGSPGTWTQISSSTSGATLGANTFGGNQTAPAFASSGLTGATSASRYAGATTSGAPASGTFAVGDFVLDQSGKAWICVTAGTPGSWAPIGSGTGAIPPSLHGLAAMNMDPSVVNTTTAPSASTHYVFKVVAQSTQTVSKAYFFIATTAGVGCSGWYASLYDSSGNLIAGSTSSADQAAQFQATGSVAASFGAATSVVAGKTYYISLGAGTATTMPTMARISNGFAANIGLTNGVASATSPRWGTAANAYASGVAPGTLGTISGQSITWLAAIG